MVTGLDVATKGQKQLVALTTMNCSDRLGCRASARVQCPAGSTGFALSGAGLEGKEGRLELEHLCSVSDAEPLQTTPKAQDGGDLGYFSAESSMKKPAPSPHSPGQDAAARCPRRAGGSAASRGGGGGGGGDACVRVPPASAPPRASPQETGWRPRAGAGGGEGLTGVGASRAERCEFRPSPPGPHTPPPPGRYKCGRRGLGGATAAAPPRWKPRRFWLPFEVGEGEGGRERLGPLLLLLRAAAPPPPGPAASPDPAASPRRIAPPGPAASSSARLWDKPPRSAAGFESEVSGSLNENQVQGKSRPPVPGSPGRALGAAPGEGAWACWTPTPGPWRSGTGGLEAPR
ncbi:LOW QUALITY PROTEIN: uncharacterized protein LOC142363610 [Opisthocomus hoazin]|uniref:LOW QUALITY PROTEIN: uncharacterized protein LOC142363610 n=1 Tax=Opisthocomus hoazin TaxID=30419 RepID=UPI003F539233